MSKLQELADIYIEHIGLKRVSGDGIDPLLPFLMLDCMFQIYCTDIKPIKCTQLLKQVRNQWYEAYHKLNKSFFAAFNLDQTDEVVDLMDSFEEYINTPLVSTKATITSALPSTISFDNRKIIASSSLCNILAQSANIVWKKMYLINSKIGQENPLITAIDRLSTKWTTLFVKDIKGYDVDLNSSKQIANSVDYLCKQMIFWLKSFSK